jgi:hypothetical protein
MILDAIGLDGLGLQRRSVCVNSQALWHTLVKNQVKNQDSAPTGVAIWVPSLVFADPQIAHRA